MRAVLCGYYGFGNGGDEALLLSLLQMLPAHVEPVVLAAHPQAAAKRYGIACIDRWNIFSVSQAIAGADAFIWGGGSLMQDVTGKASLLYYGSLMQLAQSFGKRTIAWAQGLGPLKSRWSSEYTRRVLAGCTAVSVRDRGSAQLLDRWQIRYELVCDPVWGLEPLSGPPSPTQKSQIAVVLRPHLDLDARRQSVLVAALERLQRATDSHILCVPFQQPGDVALARAIAESLGPCCEVVAESDPRRLSSLFAGVDLTIAMRLHGVLIAAAAGSRVWGISYDPKVAQLLAQIEAPGCDLARLPDDPEVLAQFWIDHYRRGRSLDEAERRHWRALAWGNAAVLQRVLDRQPSGS
ncbi:polysaccharide pyruvyl transferase CsaB [Gloeobacter kilaueensis]|uniref:Polysaccharide pyruvyl transferase CsaB n=1 Tax=Gloeobacter kilaueensis (strain ATCC BAA-2537 / CCAP 1431/1 / ULC 316 / JS1) TaxID=1183438 RepID=U5QI70_GLOK1|nr:polysaccharide pyruvyl transferase CsaB [Gloeobacter kilaueensis]AGY57330.1 polysaccharide pyruvyl transferase CsaB [Gloeobacter kilaueensis JS1]